MPIGESLVPRGVHACVLASSVEHRWDLVADFAVDGLRRHERVLLVGVDPADEALTMRVGDAGLDAEDLSGCGQPRFVAEAEAGRIAALPSRGLEVLTSEVDRAHASGFSSLRLSGRNSGLAGLERHADRLVLQRPGSTVLCPYLLDALDEQQAGRLRQGHELSFESVYDDGLVRLTRARDGAVRLTGELDVSNRTALVAAIDQLIADRQETLEVHLGGLRFADVSGVRALLAVDGLEHVRLTQVSDSLSRLMRLVGSQSF